MLSLSDAIRLGAMLKPQGYEGTGSRECSATCAYGAALGAVSADCVTVVWPWLATLSGLQCPACVTDPRPSSYGNGLGMVPHLNNDHRWTREQIADWVATIEPATAPIEQPDAAVVA